MISPKPGLKFWRTGWHELKTASASIDLTQYVDKKTAKIYRGPIDAGSFDAFHLKIKTIEGLLKKNQRGATVKNAVGPVKLSFDVAPKGETILLIDLVVTDCPTTRRAVMNWDYRGSNFLPMASSLRKSRRGKSSIQNEGSFLFYLLLFFFLLIRCWQY